MRIDEFFELTLVINLDRRDDRWRQVVDECHAAGCEPVRIAAHDGRSQAVRAAYERYLRSRPLHAGTSPIGSTFEFFQGGFARAERTLYREAERSRPGIESAGAFAYLDSYREALSQALASGADPVLILDDDCRFHRRTGTLLQLASAQLPDDWLVLQLGNLQYHWTEKWIVRHSRNLYRNLGATIGSHAVGYRRVALAEIVESFEPRLLPYDIGVLSEYVQARPERAFVCLPNLAIQDLSDSDIKTSILNEADFETAGRRLRWNLSDYSFISEAGR